MIHDIQRFAPEPREVGTPLFGICPHTINHIASILPLSSSVNLAPSTRKRSHCATNGMSAMPSSLNYLCLGLSDGSDQRVDRPEELH